MTADEAGWLAPPDPSSARRVRVAYRVGVAVVVEVDEQLVAGQVPFPDPVSPPPQVGIGVGADVQVMMIWAVHERRARGLRAGSAGAVLGVVGQRAVPELVQRSRRPRRLGPWATIPARLVRKLNSARYQAVSSVGGCGVADGGVLAVAAADVDLRARGRHRLMVPTWLPGQAARAGRADADLAPDRAVGRRTWEEFLADR